MSVHFWSCQKSSCSFLGWLLKAQYVIINIYMWAVLFLVNVTYQAPKMSRSIFAWNYGGNFIAWKHPHICNNSSDSQKCPGTIGIISLLRYETSLLSCNSYIDLNLFPFLGPLSTLLTIKLLKEWLS